MILITTKTARLRKIIIKEEDGSPVPGATLSILPGRLGGDTLNLFADSEGVVTTDKLLNKQPYNLNVSSVGYQIKRAHVYFGKSNEEIITLNKQYKNCDEVAIVSYGTKRCRFRGCCLWSITKQSFLSTKKEIPQKESFKMFPNPASRGTQINIQLPKEIPAGSKIQLYNISGQLILQQQINRESAIQKMHLPQIAQGIYHVWVLNSQSQKVLGGKLVVL